MRAFISAFLFALCLPAAALADIVAKDGSPIELTVIDAAVCTSEADLLRFMELINELEAEPDNLQKQGELEKMASALSNDRRCYAARTQVAVPREDDLIAMLFRLIDQGRRLTVNGHKVVIISGAIIGYAYRGGRVDDDGVEPIIGYTFANEDQFDALISRIAKTRYKI